MHGEWARVFMGVPQGSILGRLLFLIFINNLPYVVEKCTINLYADDTTIYSADVNPVMVSSRVESDLRESGRLDQLQWSENECGKDTINASQ